MPVLTPHVPDGLIDLMKALTKSILKEKPEDIYKFAMQHFEKLIIERDGNLDKGYERFRSESQYFKEKKEYEKLLKKNQRSAEKAPIKEQTEVASDENVTEEKDTQSAQAVQRTNKFKTRKLSSRKPSETLIAIKEEDGEETAKHELDNEMQRREWAAFKIQRAFRRFYEKIKKGGSGGKSKMSQETAALIIQRTLKTIFRRKKLDDDKTEQTKLDDSVDITPRIDSSEVDKMETDISTEVSKEMSAVPAGNIKKSLGFPLRQNSDDPHPSIAFGERCAEADEKQDLLKSDLKIEDSDAGPSTDVKTDEVDPMHQGSQESEVVKKQSLEDSIPKEQDEEKEIVDKGAEKDLDSHENENAEETKLVDTKDGILTKESSSDLQIGKDKDQPQQRGDTDKQSNLQGDEVSSSIAQEEKISEQGEEKHVAENILKEPGKTTEGKSDEKHVENGLNKQEEVKDTAKIENGDSLGNEHLIPMDDTVGSLAKMLKHEKEEKELDETDKSEKLDSAQKEITDEKKADGKSPNPPDSSGNMDNLQDKADNQDSKDTAEKSHDHLVPMDDTVESLADMIKHEKEVKEMDKTDKGELAERSSSESSDVKTAEEEAIREVTGKVTAADTSKSDGKLESEAENQDLKNIGEESDNHLVPMDDTIESLANMIKHEKEEKEMDKGDKIEEAKSPSSEPTNVDKDHEQGTEKITSAKKASATSGNSDKLKPGVDGQDTNIAEDSDKHLVPMDDTVESLANMIKYEKEEKEIDKTNKGEEDQSSSSEPRKDNNVEKKDIEEIVSDKKSIDTSGDHEKLDEKGNSQDSKANAEKSDNHLVPMDDTVESLANIIKQEKEEKEMDKTGKPEQGESSFSEPTNTNSSEANGIEEVINERESVHASGKDNKLEETVDSEDTKNIVENSGENAEKASDMKETSSADSHLVPMDGTLESLAKMIKHEKDEKLHETDPPVEKSTTDTIESTSENPGNPSSEENQDEVNSEIGDGPGEKVMITATAEETEPLILENDILSGESETKFDHLAEKGSDLTKTQEDNESEKKNENQSEESSHGIGAPGAKDSNDASLLATETTPQKDETDKAATESTEQTGDHVNGEQISDEGSEENKDNPKVQSLEDKEETHEESSKDELTEAEIKAIEAEIIEPEIVQKTNSLTESAKVEEQDPPAGKPESKAGSVKSNADDKEDHQDEEVSKKSDSDSASAEIGASGGIPKGGASAKEKSNGNEASEDATSIGLNIEGDEISEGDAPAKESSGDSVAPEVAADIGVNTKDSVAPTEIQNGDVNETAGVTEALSGEDISPVQGSKSVDLDKASGVEPEVIVETIKHENQALPKKESDDKSATDEQKDENLDQDKANTQKEEHAQNLTKSSPQNVDNPIQPTEDVDTKAGSEIHSDVEKRHLDSQETGQFSVNEENQKEAESQDKSVELASAPQNDESVPDKVDTPESDHVNGASSSLLNESTSPLSTESKQENELPTDESASEKTSNSKSDSHDNNTEETQSEEGPSSQQKDNLPESAPESKKEAENVSDSTDILKGGIQTTAVQDDAGDSGKLPENGDSEGTASTESSDPKEPSSSKDENVPVLAVEVSEADEKKLGGGIKENSKELPSAPLVEQEVPPESVDSKATSDPLTDAKESGVASDFEKSKELTTTSENANWNEESLAESIRDFKGRTSDSTKIVGEDEKLVKDQPATAVSTMGSGANFEDESNTFPPATSNAANGHKDELPQEVDNLSIEDKSQGKSTDDNGKSNDDFALADSENIIESNPSEKWSEVQPDKNAENKTSTNMTAESNPNLGNPSSELDLENQTDEDNMSEAELSGVIFEDGENKENEAGNPQQMNKNNTKSNMQGTPKSDKDDFSNADVIGNQLVEARNDLEITDDSRYVPDSNLCDTNNKDKASELNQSDIEESNGRKRTKRSLSPFDSLDGSSCVRQQFDDDFVNIEDPWKAANEVGDDVTSNEKDHLKIASVPGEFGTSKEPAVENVPEKVNGDSMKTFAEPSDKAPKKPEKTDIVNRNDKSKSVEEKPKSGKNPGSAQQRARDVAGKITIKDAQKQHQPDNSPGSDPSLGSVGEKKQETGADRRPSSVKNKDQNQPSSDSGKPVLLDNGKVVSKDGEPMSEPQTTLQITKPKSEIGSTSLDERQVSEISQKDQNVAKDLKNEGTNVGSSPKRAVENLSNPTKDLSSEAEEKSKAEKNGDTTTENSKNQLASNSSNPTISAPSEDKGKSKMGTNGETSSTNPGEGSLSNPTVLSSAKTEEEPKEGTNKDFEISSFENNAPTDGFKEETKDRKDKKDETIPEYKSDNPQPETEDAGVEVSKEINPLNITSEPKLEEQIATTANHQEKEKNPHDITHPNDTKLDNVLKNTQEVSSNTIPSAPIDSNSLNVTSDKEKDNGPQESNIKSALADSEKEQQHEKREINSKTNIEGQPRAEKSSMEANPQTEVAAVKKNVSGVEAQMVTKPTLHDADFERSKMKGHSEQEAEPTSDNKLIGLQPESSEDKNVLLPKNSPPDTIDQEKTHLEQDETNLKTNSENALSDSQKQAEIDQPAAGDNPSQSKVSSKIQSGESKVVATKTQEPEKSPLVNTESTDQKLENPSKKEEEAHQEPTAPLFNEETEKSNNDIDKDNKASQSSSDKIEDLDTEKCESNMKNTPDNGPMDPKQEIKEPTAETLHLAQMTSGITPKKEESAADASQETTKSPSDSENAGGVKSEDLSKQPEEKLSIPKCGTENQEVNAVNEIEKKEDTKNGTISAVDNKNVDYDPQQPSNGLTPKRSDDPAQQSEMLLKTDSNKEANVSVDDQESDKPLSSNKKQEKDHLSKEIAGSIENPQQGPLNDKGENSKIISDKNKEESLLEKMVPPNSTDKVKEQKEESNQGTSKEKKEEKPNELQKHNIDANLGMTQPMPESEEFTKSSSAINGKETVPDKTEDASKNPPVNIPGDVGKMASVMAKDSDEKKIHEIREEVSSDPKPSPEKLIKELAKETLLNKDKNDESESNEAARQVFTEEKPSDHQDEMKVVQEQTLSDHSPSKNSEDQTSEKSKNNPADSATKSGHSHSELDKKVAAETTDDRSLNLAVSEKTNGAKTSDETIDKHELPDPGETVRNPSRQSSANKLTSHSEKPAIDDVALKDPKSGESAASGSKGTQPEQHQKDTQPTVVSLNPDVHEMEATKLNVSPVGEVFNEIESAKPIDKASTSEASRSPNKDTSSSKAGSENRKEIGTELRSKDEPIVDKPEDKTNYASELTDGKKIDRLTEKKSDSSAEENDQLAKTGNASRSSNRDKTSSAKSKRENGMTKEEPANEADNAKSMNPALDSAVSKDQTKTTSPSIEKSENITDKLSVAEDSKDNSGKVNTVSIESHDPKAKTTGDKDSYDEKKEETPSKDKTLSSEYDPKNSSTHSKVKGPGEQKEEDLTVLQNDIPVPIQQKMEAEETSLKNETTDPLKKVLSLESAGDIPSPDKTGQGLTNSNIDEHKTDKKGTEEKHSTNELLANTAANPNREDTKNTEQIESPRNNTRKGSKDLTKPSSDIKPEENLSKPSSSKIDTHDNSLPVNTNEDKQTVSKPTEKPQDSFNEQKDSKPEDEKPAKLTSKIEKQGSAKSHDSKRSEEKNSSENLPGAATGTSKLAGQDTPFENVENKFQNEAHVKSDITDLKEDSTTSPTELVVEEPVTSKTYKTVEAGNVQKEFKSNGSTVEQDDPVTADKGSPVKHNHPETAENDSTAKRDDPSTADNSSKPLADTDPNSAKSDDGAKSISRQTTVEVGSPEYDKMKMEPNLMPEESKATARLDNLQNQKNLEVQTPNALEKDLESTSFKEETSNPLEANSNKSDEANNKLHVKNVNIKPETSDGPPPKSTSETSADGDTKNPEQIRENLTKEDKTEIMTINSSDKLAPSTSITGAVDEVAGKTLEDGSSKQGNLKEKSEDLKDSKEQDTIQKQEEVKDNENLKDENQTHHSTKHQDANQKQGEEKDQKDEKSSSRIGADFKEETPFSPTSGSTESNLSSEGNGTLPETIQTNLAPLGNLKGGLNNKPEKQGGMVHSSSDNVESTLANSILSKEEEIKEPNKEQKGFDIEKQFNEPKKEQKGLDIQKKFNEPNEDQTGSDAQKGTNELNKDQKGSGEHKEINDPKKEQKGVDAMKMKEDNLKEKTSEEDKTKIATGPQLGETSEGETLSHASAEKLPSAIDGSIPQQNPEDTTKPAKIKKETEVGEASDSQRKATSETKADDIKVVEDPKNTKPDQLDKTANDTQDVDDNIEGVSRAANQSQVKDNDEVSTEIKSDQKLPTSKEDGTTAESPNANVEGKEDSKDNTKTESLEKKTVSPLQSATKAPQKDPKNEETLVDSDKNKDSDTKKAGQGSEKKDPVKVVSLPEVSLKPKEGLEGQHIDNIAENSEPTMGHENRVEKDSDEPTAKKTDLSNVTTEPASQVSQEGTKKGSDITLTQPSDERYNKWMMLQPAKEDENRSSNEMKLQDEGDIDPASVVLSDHLTQKSEPNIDGETVEEIIPQKQMPKMLAKSPSKTEKMPTSSDETNKGGEEPSKSSKTEHNVPTSANKYGKIEETLDSKEKLAHTPKSESEDGEAKKTDAVKLEEKSPSTLDLKKVETETKKGDADAKQDDNGVKKGDTEDKKDDPKDQAGNVSKDKKEDEVVEKITSDKIQGEEDLVEKAKNFREVTPGTSQSNAVIPNTQIQTNIEQTSADNHDSNRAKESLPLGDKKQENFDSEKALSLPKSATEKVTPSTFERNFSKTVDSTPEKYDKKESQTKLDKNLDGKGQITESAVKPSKSQEGQLEMETPKEAISVKSTEDNDPKKAKEKMQSTLKDDVEKSEGKPTEADISKSKTESTLKEEPEKIRKDSAKLVSKAFSGKLTDKHEVLSETMVSPPKSSKTSANKFEEKDKLEQGNLEKAKDSTSEKNRSQLEPTAPVVSSTKASDSLKPQTLLNDSMVSDSNQQASNAATSFSSEASSMSPHPSKRNLKKSHSAITDSPNGKNKSVEGRTKSAKDELHAENITSSSVPLLSTDHDLPRNEGVSPIEDKKDELTDVEESKKPGITKHVSSKNLKPDSVISTEESISEAKSQLSTEKQQTKDDISNQDIEKVDLAAIESQILTPEADITKKPHDEKASGSDISNTDSAAKQIFDAAAKTIQHAFRSYKDHKDEPQPDKDTSSSSDIKSLKSLDPERKTSITIVETNNGLDVVAHDTDSKAIWYVGEEPIIPTATPTKEIEHPFENISTDSVVFGQLLDSGNESGQTSFDSSGKLDDPSKIGKVGSVLNDQPKPTNLKKETGEDPVKKSEASESLNVESKPDTKLQSEKVELAQSQPLEINDSKSDNYILSDVKEISSTAKDTNVIPAPQKVKDGGTTIELKETSESAETNLKSPTPPMEKPSNLVEKLELTKKDSQSLPAKDETPVNKDSSLEEKSKSTERTAQPIPANLEVSNEKKPKESVGDQTKTQESHPDKLHTSSTGKSSEETKKKGKPVVGASDPDNSVLETTENVAVHAKDEPSLTSGKPIDSKNEAEMPVIIEPTIEPDSLEPDYTSPRSDVENMDISMYGEDSLEAMYYSLKKHEMLLDKMHKQASVCKSASSERPKLDATVENVSEGTSSTSDTSQEENSQIKDADKKPANEDKSQENDTQKSTPDLDNKVASVEENSELTVEIAPVKERRLSRNDSYYEACLSRPITSASISPRTKAELDSENPIELSRKRTEHFIKQLHTPSTDKNISIDVDETTNDEIRRNMLAYSMSEADSDYCEPGERTNALFNDFNISTAFETTPSTDTDSTIISAVTKIQAGARGFLTRRRLRRASVATTSFPERKPSFGNDAIGESLEDFIGEEDAAKRIQKSFRRYRNRKTRQSAPSLRNNVTEESSSKSSNSSDEKVMKIIDVKLEHKPSAPKGNQEEGKINESDQRNDLGKIESRETTLSEEKKQEPGMSLDGLNLAARRMTLQRGDAVQSNSTGEDESSSTSGNGSEERADINQSSKKQLPRAKSSGTERAEKKKPEPRNDVERIKRFGTRQRTMPVQIDFEILRVLPKHLRKRIQSAEHQNKRKTDL
ncbi:unnamed protein product [Hermetia illucens]|uniref:RIIa domain-containing protein n=1 Tax=Hermetia illucens TaxID=343691 RepID=A0A7R8UNP4_HERIL|nr:titin homolog isoform X2 [Hermetia illucens]CAD7084177.1 unnamed protein product [Hermetia illucens]